MVPNSNCISAPVQELRSYWLDYFLKMRGNCWCYFWGARTLSLENISGSTCRTTKSFLAQLWSIHRQTTCKKNQAISFSLRNVTGTGSPPPKPKITTKSWITSPFFDQIIWFFLHLVCLSTLNWCAKKVFVIYHSSWDNSKLLAEPWYPSYPFLGGILDRQVWT